MFFSYLTMQKIWDLSILDVATKLQIQYGTKGTFRKCRCFMHADKNPSMWFKTSNNTWSCPVCGKGGGLVSLVRLHEGLSFDEAVRWIAREFNIPVEEENSVKYNHPKTIRPMPKLTTTTTESPSTSLLDFKYVAMAQSTETTFCRSLVSTGILTARQMEQAAALYHLGRTNDGGVIFWSIDHHQQLHEGKIMWYLDDCHRNHRHDPSTISSRLKNCGVLTNDWQASFCLFGQHLLRNDDRIIAIVESEKTAVICSQYMSEYIWMACGGLTRLKPEVFVPLKDHRIIVFPDTDPNGEAHRQWTGHCKEAARLTGQNIYVSPILEQKATPSQKERKIDIADFLIESK